MRGSPAIAAAILIVAAGVSVAASQEPRIDPQVPLVITMGDAVIRRAPDRAFVNVSVESRAKNPRDAQRQNAQAMTAVQERLRQAGVTGDAVRTVGVSLDQEFDNLPTGRVSRGFLARNSVEARIDAIARVGEVIDAVVSGGATAIDGVRFELSDRAAAEREALRLAVVDARARADAAAAGAGRTVDRVLRIDDSREPVMPRQMVMTARAMEASTTPIEPGVIEIRSHVTLTASLK